MQYDENVAHAYLNLWNKTTLNHIPAIDGIIDNILKYKDRYVAAEKVTNVPWFVIGCIHYMEADFNFNTIIANGDPLGVPTRDVPRGLIAHTWEEGVYLSFKQNGISANHNWALSCTLYYLERYNGFGYRQYGINSPYLWSFTDNYSRGKYVSDGRYSASAVSGQCGAAAILFRMVQKGILFCKGDVLSDNPIQDVAAVVTAPLTVAEGALAGAAAGVVAADAHIANPQPRASDFAIPGTSPVLPNAMNGTQVDPAEIVSHDVLMLIGAIIMYAAAHGAISDATTHWAINLLQGFGGALVTGLAVFLRRVTIKGTNENVQSLIGQNNAT